MYRNKLAIAVLLTVAVLLLSMAASATPTWMLGPSTVYATLLERDGEEVELSHVIISKICARQESAYFVVRDQYQTTETAERNSIVVLCRPPLELRRGQSVSISGVLGTLTSGERCVINPTTYAFYDREGRRVNWAPLPFTDLAPWLTKAALDIPVTDIPPSDPSMPSTGRGYSGVVTAADGPSAIRYDTVAGLSAAAPPVLSTVKIAAKPIVNVGDGYIEVGDDNSGSTVKVYTAAASGIKLGDRVIGLAGTAHSEDGRLVLYSGDGPSPFYDPQGTDASGGVLSAKPGTVAYISTLRDPVSESPSGGARVMTVGSSETDGDWIYLTGMLTTTNGGGYFYSYDVDTLVGSYYIKGLDMLPGIRVLAASGYSPSYAGSVVDIMAKVNTQDGQRQLGFYNATAEYMVDQTLANHSLEVNILATKESSEGSDLPMIAPLGMNNRTLGGADFGSNPSITDGTGLYNIGQYVKIWGKVLQCGQYYFSTYGDMPYMIIDDGSYVDCGHSSEALYGPYGEHGVIVFGTNSYDGGFNFVEVGDYVSVTGVSAVWRPDTLTDDSYRSLFTTSLPVDMVNGYGGGTSQITDYGDVSGIVKLYDMPDETATVQVSSTCGGPISVPITRNATTGAGSGEFCWEDVPQVEQPLYGQSRNIDYMVSAKCEGFKTRTYTLVVPDTPRNIYTTPLRKIYVTTNTTSIDACSGSATITATVRDADHELVTDNLTIRFRTNKGSFVSGGTIEHEATRTTSTGTATATLYAVASEHGDVVVEATEDSAPHAGDDPDDDPYKYDWQQVHTQYGVPTTIGMTIAASSIDLDLTAEPLIITRCSNDTSEITATITICGVGVGDTVVTFRTLNKGVFTETSTDTATATTNAQGVATAHLRAVDNTPGSEGSTRVIATAWPYGVFAGADENDEPVIVTISHDKLVLTAEPAALSPSQRSSTITAKLSTPSGAGISGKQVTFTRTAGDLSVYTGTTNASGEVTTILSNVPQGGFAVVEATTTNNCDITVTGQIRVERFQDAGDDWPMFMHNAQHTGMSRTWDITTETLTATAWTPVSVPTASTVRTGGVWNNHPNPAGGNTWIFEHPYIDSSPVVIGNKVLVGTWTGSYNDADGTVKAFVASSGAEVSGWSAPGMGGVASTPCIYDEKVFVGDSDGYLYCLALSDGHVIWQRQTTDRSTPAQGSKILSSPVVHNGVVYITNEASKIYAFTADDNGTLVTGYPIVLPIDESGHGNYGNGVTDVSQQNICGASSPAIATVGENTYLLVGCDDGYIYRIDLNNRNVSGVDLDACVEASPTIVGDEVFVGVSRYDGFDAYRVSIEPFEKLTESEICAPATSEECRATMASGFGRLYVGVDTGHTFHKLNPSSLTNDATPFDSSLFPETGYYVGSAGLSTGGIAYVGNDNGKLYALSTNDLSKITSYATSGFICSSPAISYNVDGNDRWVFVTTRADGGKLLAFKTDR